MTWKHDTGYDIDEEIEQHLEDRYRELVASGASDEEARGIVREEIRGWTPRAARLDGVGGDVRFALRTLRRTTGFTIVVLTTLALGIGANAAIFSVVNAVVLRPLPFPDADRLVIVRGNLHRPGVEEIPASAGEYVDYRDRSRAFDEIAAYDTLGFNLTGRGEPERVDGAIATASLFTALGVRAAIGRTFLAEEEQAGRNDVAILSHALWTRRFAGDPAIVAQTIALDGRPVDIVGVMPPGFAFPDETTEIWKPVLVDADALSADNRGSHGFTLVGRMKRGVPPAQARADLDAVASTFGARFPNNYRYGFTTVVRRLQDEIVGGTSRALFVLLAAVGVVLLTACANVANLLLARGASRRKEIALRTALGASRGRLMRQLLTESVLLAAGGGAIGLVLAAWGVPLLVAAAPDSIPRLHEVTLDARAVAFTSVVSIATGLLFGLVPAAKMSRGALNDALKEGGRTASAHGRTGRVFVAAEVALSLVLLVAAALLVRSLARLQEVRPGFDPERLLTLRLSLPESRYTTFEQGDRFFADLTARLRAAPGVRGVAAVNAMPFSGVGGSRSFRIEGRTETRADQATEEQLRIVSDGYFGVMGIPIVRGREFTARDGLAAPRAAVVSEAFARKHFAGKNAVGKRVSFEKDSPVWYEIVGVAGDIKHRGLDAPDRPELYVPYRQPLFANWTVRPMYFVVRTDGEPLAAGGVVRREIARLDSQQPISDLRPMTDRIERSLAARRFSTALLALFAALAASLAAVGIYGIVGYAVTERTHEIGVRLALGATPRDVLAMVLREGLGMAAVGTVAGLAASLAAVRLIASQLYGVGAADPATFIAVPLLLFAVASVACFVPARRATRVDPVFALRAE
ncbi:MAG: hypothetical protein DMF93_07100 [Acidobacteria bacterium]|nr:MAG: hypothetical protein DMF93_07100 [Acidobacteriota bacterium]